MPTKYCRFTKVHLRKALRLLKKCNERAEVEVQKMITPGQPNELWVVKLVRSRIGQPWQLKDLLIRLGLTKTNKTMIHKNSASINSDLLKVAHLIELRPLVIKEVDGFSKGNRGLLLSNGQYLTSPLQKSERLAHLEEKVKLLRRSDDQTNGKKDRREAPVLESSV